MWVATHELGMSLEMDSVDEIIDYQTAEADKSVLLNYSSDIHRYRTYYLKNLRMDWEWVDSSKKGKPFVLLKRR